MAANSKMPYRRSRFLPRLSALSVLLAIFGGLPAYAGVFDDEEARRQIKDLSIRSNERIDTLFKAQFDFVNLIQTLREENAKLRGQVETLNYELESTKKRQQDFYIDLDGRLRKLEPQPALAADATNTPPLRAVVAKRPPTDPAAESREYEKALDFFKANKIKDAASTFDSFVKTHPDSTLAPNAQYWLGNAYFALHDCKKAIDAHNVVINKWPQYSKAPDSMINIATCQQELRNTKAVKATLESILIKYPGTSAAATAKQRLKK